ncbi:MAG: acetolactate synthase large subunit [Acidimicrobiia bacterium]|nr:MAG: acetolactate synthase large subunit [Acidimicrobiia bacterium]
MTTDTHITGAQALIAALEREGVDVVFGIPGGAILPAYDPLLDGSMRHVLARHEQGAGHMAEGYAQATGRVGVVITTSGPGATNLITPLQNALMDSTPIVAITGQVSSGAIGTDAFQEAYTSGLAMHCAKHSYLVTDADDIVPVIQEAFHLAGTGRPGPVLVDISKDALKELTRLGDPQPVVMEGYNPTIEGNFRQLRAAIELLEAAQRPVLFVGGGVIKAGGNRELLAFAEAVNAPVVTTLMARGAFPDQHRLALGMSGMHGNYTATTAIQRSDLLFSIAARFDDRVTGDLATFAPEAKVVHIDIDPAEIGKVVHTDVPIVGDARVVLGQLLTTLEKQRGQAAPPQRTAWFETLADWQQRYPLAYDQDPDGPIKVQYFVDQLQEATGGEAVVVAGVGQHQMWVSQFWRFTEPRSWINSGGLGTMGFAVPAAIGAKVARPDDLVFALDGDGCFQMTCQELITAATEQIPIKVAVFNNHGYGMVRQWQRLFYGGRYSGTDLGTVAPDYPALAESMGCVGLRADRPAEVAPIIDKALAINDRPVVIEVVVDPDEMCFPMVTAGGSCNNVAMGPEDL